MKRARSAETLTDVDRTLSSPDSPLVPPPPTKRLCLDTHGRNTCMQYSGGGAPGNALEPRHWIPEKTGTHQVADMALRMLWSWVTPYAPVPTVSVADMAQTWFGGAAAATTEVETARVARALNDRLVFDSPVECRPAHTSTHPRLYWAHLKRVSSPCASVVIKWHPFFAEGRDEYEWLAHRARTWALERDAEGRSRGMAARFEPLLAFTLDVLHGKWLAQLPAELSAHVAVTLDAMALPRLAISGADAGLSPKGGTGLYAIMERGDETLFEHVLEHGADGFPFASVQWQAFFALYVLGVHAGWTHEDAHPRNVMFRQATGDWVDRDWLYVLPGVGPSCRYYVVPARVHGNKMTKLIDFGRSRIDPDVDDATLDKRLRFDFQLLLHGHLRAHRFHDPFKVPRAAFSVKTSMWAGVTRLPLTVRRGLVRRARQLCDPATKVSDWPSWVAAPGVCGPYASLAEAMAAFPGTLILAGALTSQRRGAAMDPRHDVARAVAEGRLTRGVTR